MEGLNALLMLHHVEVALFTVLLLSKPGRFQGTSCRVGRVCECTILLKYTENERLQR